MLFGAVPEPTERRLRDPFGRTVSAGTPVRVARIGERVVAVPVAYGAGGDAWPLADAVVTADALQWLPGAWAADLLIAGCDPILEVWARLAERSEVRMLPVAASTGRAVRALADGRVHGIVVHGPAGDLPEPPTAVQRWHVARWQVGIAGPMTRRTAPSIEELAASRGAVVQRDSGAGVQRALERALRGAGAAASLPGPVASSHLEVARRVSYEQGMAGVLMEPAALALNLPFTALEQHTVQLWIDRRWLALPAVTALLDTLTGDGLRQRARLLGGYDATGCGTALPEPAGHARTRPAKES